MLIFIVFDVPQLAVFSRKVFKMAIFGVGLDAVGWWKDEVRV